MSKLWIFLGLAAFFLVFSNYVFAEEITVCPEACLSRSIDGGIAKASDGDSIILSGMNLWSEDLTINKNITLNCNDAEINGTLRLESDSTVSNCHFNPENSSRSEYIILLDSGNAKLYNISIKTSGFSGLVVKSSNNLIDGLDLRIGKNSSYGIIFSDASNNKLNRFYVEVKNGTAVAFFNSPENTLSSGNVKLSGNDTIGFHFASSDFNTIDDIFVRSTGHGGKGVVLYDSIKNKYSNLRLFSSDNKYLGFLFYSGSNGNNIYNSRVISTGGKSFGLLLNRSDLNAISDFTVSMRGALSKSILILESFNSSLSGVNAEVLSSGSVSLETKGSHYGQFKNSTFLSKGSGVSVILNSSNWNQLLNVNSTILGDNSTAFMLFNSSNNTLQDIVSGVPSGGSILLFLLANSTDNYLFGNLDRKAMVFEEGSSASVEDEEKNETTADTTYEPPPDDNVVIVYAVIAVFLIIIGAGIFFILKECGRKIEWEDF